MKKTDIPAIAESKEIIIKDLHKQITELQKRNFELQNEYSSIRWNHMQEISGLNMKHLNEISEIRKAHQAEIINLQKENFDLKIKLDMANEISQIGINQTKKSAQIIESLSDSKKGRAASFQKTEIERVDLENMRRNHENFLNLITENKRFRKENMVLQRKLQQQIYTTTEVSNLLENLRQEYQQLLQYWESAETRANYFLKKATAFEKNARAFHGFVEPLHNNLPKPICEDKSVQTFSEMSIAEALLKSQSKRLRYLK